MKTSLELDEVMLIPEERIVKRQSSQKLNEINVTEKSKSDIIVKGHICEVTGCSINSLIKKDGAAVLLRSIHHSQVRRCNKKNNIKKWETLKCNFLERNLREWINGFSFKGGGCYLQERLA